MSQCTKTRSRLLARGIIEIYVQIGAVENSFEIWKIRNGIQVYCTNERVMLPYMNAIQYSCKPTQLKYCKMDVPRSPSLSSLSAFADDEEPEMPSTVWFGWYPTTVSAFISKYAAVQWHLHGIAPPLGLINTANDAEKFQIAFLECVASRLDGVTIDGNRALVCSHQGVLCRLFDELSRGLAEESWVQIVLEQGPPLSRKLAKLSIVAYGKPYDLFMREHVLFE